ncbi:MAG: hypothetical protein U1E45_11385 [Geminicoccaceae bacterium]
MRRVLVAGALLIALVGAAAGVWYASQPLLQVYHAPGRVGLREGDVTANITGRLGAIVRDARYRVNGGVWRPVLERPPRVRRPDFTVEMTAAELRPGTNSVEVEAKAPLRAAVRATFDIDYDAAPPALPTTVRWDASSLDVQDGRWEVVEGPDGAPWVRPVPGFEGWDRLTLAAPPFRGGRKISTTLRLRAVPDTGERDWGFGLFPLWGGRPDPSNVHPALGWRFAIAWYSRNEGGVAAGMSERLGDIRDTKGIVEKLRMKVEAGVSYRLVVEVRELRRPDGSFRGWAERMKWWPEGAPEPAHWVEVEDRTGMVLPDQAYAVGVFSLRAAAEFGPPTIESLPPVILPEGSD